MFRHPAIFLLAAACLLRGVASLSAQDGEPSEETPAVIKRLSERLSAKDTDQDSRIAICMALRKHGPAAKEAVPALVELLQRCLETQKAGYLARVYEYPKGRSPAGYAPHMGVELREACAALGKIGPDAEAAVPVLIKILETSKGQVQEKGERYTHGGYRADAAQALGGIGSAKALVALRAAAEGDGDEGVRRRAKEAVDRIKEKKDK